MRGNTTQDDEAPQLSTDVLLDLLSHERRRYALACLKRYQTPMPLADLADEVARAEYDADTLRQVPADAVKEIYLDLYHSHIPKLEDAHLLAYSQEQDAVELRCDLSELGIHEFI